MEGTSTSSTMRVEFIMFYVDPKSVGSLNFLGRERVRFPITDEHSSLAVFTKRGICRIKDRGGRKVASAPVLNLNFVVSKREKMALRPLRQIHIRKYIFTRGKVGDCYFSYDRYDCYALYIA